MELWIRSQDKERIIKTNQLDIMEFDTDVDPRYNHFGVYVNEYLAGEYKTKERALEVLDEIQNIINNNGVKSEKYDEISGCYYTVKKNVYEMPKE